MAIDELTALVPPPAGRDAGEVDWEAIERELGTTLPEDYKQIIAAYGDGSFGDFIHLYQPRSANPDHDIVRRYTTDLDALRTIQRDFPEDVPYRLEEPAELLPVGLTDNGDVLYWRRTEQKDPAGWTIVVGDSRGPDWDTFDGGIARFLTETLTGRARIGVFPRKFPHRGATFDPY